MEAISNVAFVIRVAVSLLFGSAISSSETSTKISGLPFWWNLYPCINTFNNIATKRNKDITKLTISCAERYSISKGGKRD